MLIYALLMLYNLKHSEEILKAKTNSELRSICKDEWDSDGTFDAAPGTLTEMFAQLYVFHGKIDGQKFPLVFCLMETREAIDYIEIIQVIIEYSYIECWMIF